MGAPAAVRGSGDTRVRDLEDLIIALDRRVPQIDRLGERGIAADAAALKAKATERLRQIAGAAHIAFVAGAAGAASPAAAGVDTPEARWGAWMGRGAEHDRRVNRRLAAACLLAMTAAALSSAVWLSFGGAL